MRRTHGCSISRYCHLPVKYRHRNLKHRSLAALVNREKFLLSHLHIIIVRAAPHNRSHSLLILYGQRCRRFHGHSAGTALHGHLYGVSTVGQSQTRCGHLGRSGQRVCRKGIGTEHQNPVIPFFLLFAESSAVQFFVQRLHRNHKMMASLCIFLERDHFIFRSLCGRFPASHEKL